MSKGEADFAAIPRRFVFDQRPRQLHWAVLAAIALFDRRSTARGKGAGCFASRDTLLQAVQCHHTNLSSAINDLGRWGYLEQFPSPSDARRRIYRVRYDGTAPASEGSLPFDKANGGKQPARDLPEGKQSRRADIRARANDPTKSFVAGDNLVCPGKQSNDCIRTEISAQEITLSVGDTVETVSTDSVETGADAPVDCGEVLKSIERDIASARGLPWLRSALGAVRAVERHGVLTGEERVLAERLLLEIPVAIDALVARIATGPARPIPADCSQHSGGRHAV